jgi:hypothetical protein
MKSYCSDPLRKEPAPDSEVGECLLMQGLASKAGHHHGWPQWWHRDGHFWPVSDSSTGEHCTEPPQGTGPGSFYPFPHLPRNVRPEACPAHSLLPVKLGCLTSRCFTTCDGLWWVSFGTRSCQLIVPGWLRTVILLISRLRHRFLKDLTSSCSCVGFFCSTLRLWGSSRFLHITVLCSFSHDVGILKCMYSYCKFLNS